jgi:hypothetical protein
MGAMQTAKTFDPIRLLRSLAELDYDMVQAYETAIAMLDDVTLEQGMRAYLEDHRRHIVELNAQIVAFGGRPWVDDDFRHVLVEGRVFLASVVGDRGVMKAMLNNEKQTSRTYVLETSIPGLPPALRNLFDRILEEELDHRWWIRRAWYGLED